MPQPIDASSISELKAVVASALTEAKQGGASQAEADASLQRGLSVTVRLGEVETIEFHRDRGLSVTVYFGTAKGSASTADLRPEAVRETVAKASAIAKHTSADPYAGLADPAELATRIPQLDLYHPWEIEAEQAIDLARECEAAGLACDARLKNSEGGSVSTGSGARVHGNSLGFLEGLTSTSHSVSCTLVAQERDDMQRDYWYSISRHPSALESPKAIGRRAAQRTLRRLGARQLSTRRSPVLFAPELARGLLGSFVAAVRGPAQYRRASFLLNAAGEQVFPSFLNLVERPHLLQGLASSPYDAEGVATRDRDLVRDGVLQGYVLGSYSARKLGLKTTGNAGGIHNILVEARQTGSFDELLRRMGTGFFVTELMGEGVNAVTGDYSRGASGFWVENGAIAYPVHEITIAGNLREMLRSIVAVGTDVDAQGAIRTGSILLEAMTIAGE
ncbi:MAG TPA: metalloprotease PmbA [Steroidobacteraceae bacterium]|jgi:PmbA protein|nr:metalloprotease PmbA [Steroidobacteraceae bacterium]